MKKKKLVILHVTKRGVERLELALWKMIAKQSLPIGEIEVVWYKNQNQLQGLRCDMLIIFGSQRTLKNHSCFLTKLLGTVPYFMFVEGAEEDILQKKALEDFLWSCEE